MAKGMKYHPHGSVLFCTFSLEEGLLLIANSLSNAIIKSCLARAQALHPVRLCHILVEANHVHMVLVVIDPDDVHGFIRCFKTESAHMLNGLLGRDKRTVWCEGYDSPVVLTPVRAVVAISYLYSNPAKDNLETSIDRYPGFSSWDMFRTESVIRTWKRLRRPQFTPIPKDANHAKGYSRIAERVLAEAAESQTFQLEPNAWMEAFGFHSQEDQQRINERIITRVRRIEQRAETLRARRHAKVLGRERLRSQVFDTQYRSKRSGRRTWCLSEKRHVRVKFIRFLKKLFAEARMVRERWKKGEVGVPYPPGLYPPSMPKLANAIGL